MECLLHRHEEQMADCQECEEEMTLYDTMALFSINFGGSPTAGRTLNDEATPNDVTALINEATHNYEAVFCDETAANDETLQGAAPNNEMEVLNDEATHNNETEVDVSAVDEEATGGAINNETALNLEALDGPSRNPEATPAIDATHAMETTLDTEATPAAETTLDTEATHAAETNLDTEATPATETTLDTEATPAAETTLDTEATHAAETNLDTEATPAAETTIDTEATPAAETTLDTEATHAAETTLDTEATPAAETTIDTEATPAADTTLDAEATPATEPATEATIDTEATPATEASPAAEDNSDSNDQEMLDSSGFYHPHLITMKDWRLELYDSIEFGNYFIYVDRSEDFASAVLDVYMEPDMDLYSCPEINFHGEDGRDGGGLKNEYFWLGMTALRDGKLNRRLPYFEGENDFKLPSCDATLLRRGYFKLIGKFMLHSAIHMGIGFVGLSNVVVQYILLDKFDYETPIEFNIRDLPDLELRLVVEILDKWTEHGHDIILEQEDMENIQKAALDCGFHDQITLENIPLLRAHLLYFNVIEKRRSQLDCLREAFQESKLMPFLKGRDYLYCDVFPNTNRFIYPASVVIDKIVPYDDGSHNDDDDSEDSEYRKHIGFVKEYVLEKLDGNEGIQDLVTAWTGWPDLPENQLQVQTFLSSADGNTEFWIHTCSQLMVIPSHYSKEDVYRDLDMVLKYGCYGFGSS